MGRIGRAVDCNVHSPDRDTALFLWQNIFGVWPVDGVVTDELRSRLHGYTEKAIREGATRTSWHDPDADFENEVHAWLDRVLDGPVAAELTALVSRLEAHARNDILGQKLIHLTAPGIPDIYQGTETTEDSLVDPDNRRPIDHAALRGAMERGDDDKLRVTMAALALRRARPQTFLAGGYTPLPATGSAARHLVAFLRGQDVVVAACRWTVALAETGWQDTVLPLPQGRWLDRLSGRQWAGSVPLVELLADSPVALLERTDD